MTDDTSREASHGAPPWLAEYTANVLLAAVDGDGERLRDLVTHIGTEGGHLAVFSMCWALADAAARMSGYDRHPGQIAIQVLDDSAPPADSEPDLFAARFFTAQCNGDMDTADALFWAPINADDPERLIANLTALFGLVGAIGRAKLAAENDQPRPRTRAERRPTTRRPSRAANQRNRKGRRR